jgi:energy-converting hydrogenase Eha subunit H
MAGLVRIVGFNRLHVLLKLLLITLIEPIVCLVQRSLEFDIMNLNNITKVDEVHERKVRKMMKIRKNLHRRPA